MSRLSPRDVRPARRVGRVAAPFALLLGLGWGAGAQESGGDEALARALAWEARQVALVERLAPSVAAVFPGEDLQGGGSGVVIDPEGWVLTNFHVSGTAKVLTVGLGDGRRFRARLVGIDPGGDIALLRLETRDPVPAVPLGESDAVRPGDPVLAMGNPFLLAEDFSPTVTCGIVSGVHRYRDATGSSDLVYGDCIQIDASINPGNSGGPLFSAEGVLLGINGLGGFRPDRGRVNVGVGFAASIDQIKGFLLDLRAGRQCQHGTTNATVRDVESEDGRGTRLVVDAISRESAAYHAGLRLGDQVRSLDGLPVTTQNRFLTLVSRLPAGRRVTLGVERPREDRQGVHRLELTFRLDPLWSGPARGEWQPDPELVRAETMRLLASYRGTQPATEWAREVTVTRADGTTTRRLLRARGRALRLEEGPPGSEAVSVWDGSHGWRQAPGGAVEALDPAARDALAGTAEVLAALAEAGGESRLTRCTFIGGEVLCDGRRAAVLEVWDPAGRRRLVYLDPERGGLLGLALPGADASSWEVEERWLEGPEGRFELRRVRWADGAVQERGEGRALAEAQDPTLFQRPAGTGQ